MAGRRAQDTRAIVPIAPAAAFLTGRQVDR